MPDSGTATKDYAALREDMEALRSDVSKLGDSLKDIAKDRTQTAKQRATDGAKRIRERGEAAAESLGSRIEERPLTSLAIAFGVGVVIGKVLDRR